VKSPPPLFLVNPSALASCRLCTLLGAHMGRRVRASCAKDQSERPFPLMWPNCLPNFGRCGRSQDRDCVNCPLVDPLRPAEWMAERQFRTDGHPSRHRRDRPKLERQQLRVGFQRKSVLTTFPALAGAPVQGTTRRGTRLPTPSPSLLTSTVLPPAVLPPWASKESFSVLLTRTKDRLF